MRVLVVEDEPKMANLLKSGLGEEGHSVLVAHTAPDGLELAASCDCDVAVLDVMLPGFDGFELVRRMRKAGMHTPVLMLTARDATSDVFFTHPRHLLKPTSLQVRQVLRRPGFRSCLSCGPKGRLVTKIRRLRRGSV